MHANLEIKQYISQPKNGTTEVFATALRNLYFEHVSWVTLRLALHNMG
jgi:hypothetical protein